MVENHLAARKKAALEDVEILKVLHLLEEVVTLEVAEAHLIDVLLIDQIEILAEVIENLLADLEENVEKVRNNSYKNLKPHKQSACEVFFWEKFFTLLYL